MKNASLKASKLKKDKRPLREIFHEMSRAELELEQFKKEIDKQWVNVNVVPYTKPKQKKSFIFGSPKMSAEDDSDSEANEENE